MQGTSLENLSNEFGYTKLTISRHLKKNIGKEEYKTITKNFKDFGFSSSENKEKYDTGNQNSSTSSPFEKLAQENIDESFEEGVFLKDSTCGRPTQATNKNNHGYATHVTHFLLEIEPNKTLSKKPKLLRLVQCTI